MIQGLQFRLTAQEMKDAATAQAARMETQIKDYDRAWKANNARIDALKAGPREKDENELNSELNRLYERGNYLYFESYKQEQERIRMLTFAERAFQTDFYLLTMEEMRELGLEAKPAPPKEA